MNLLPALAYHSCLALPAGLSYIVTLSIAQTGQLMCPLSGLHYKPMRSAKVVVIALGGTFQGIRVRISTYLLTH